MGFRSGISEAVAVSPVRKTMFFAAALLGLLVIFGASGSVVDAQGPKGLNAEGTVSSISPELVDGDVVKPAGNSQRFIVKDRTADGLFDEGGDLEGAFTFKFGTNVCVQIICIFVRHISTQFWDAR
ncbi:MAG: hypothetical protein IIC29_06600 [Chloroflexi bacterium]|nr:hypothetical protein [Chloroflexota bacterium]